MRRFMWLALFVIVPASAACGIPEEQYNQDIGRLRGELAETEAQRAKCVEAKAQLSEDKAALDQAHAESLRELAAMKSRGEELDAGLQQALQRIGSLEKVLAKQQGVFAKLREALDSLIKAGKLTVSVVDGQFTVQMADRILFDSGKYAIKPEAKETLVTLTQILTNVAGRKFQVAGHTDSQGSSDFNWRLSGNRSQAVLDFMIDNGMPPERISFAGFGQYQPTASNETPEDMALNRRIEIVLVPDMRPFLEPVTQGAAPSAAR